MKRLLAMILAVAMIFTMVSTTALVSAKESSFTDVIGTKDEWANDYIEKMVEKKILDGVGGGKFEPEGLLTREQFAKVLVAAIPQEDKGITAEFDDVVPGQWYEEYIKKAVASGIVKGKGDGKFGVGENIKRCDMALGIARLDKTDEELKAYEDKIPDSVGDKDTIPEYAKGAMGYCYEKGIFSGDENGNFNPFENTTRAQIAKVICVYVEGLEEEPTSEPTKEPTKEPTGEEPTSEPTKEEPYISATITHDGDFKILQIADAHFQNKTGSPSSLDGRMMSAIKLAVETENPDLLVFSGDFIQIYNKNSGGLYGEEQDRILDIFDELDTLGVKWTFSFGQADFEKRVSMDFMVKRAAKYDNCIMNPIQDENLPGYANQFIVVKNSQGKITNVISLFDTDTNGINEAQVNWYKRNLSGVVTEDMATNEIESVVIAHKPIPQLVDLRYSEVVYGENTSTIQTGKEAGMFDAASEFPRVKTIMSFGQNHGNGFYGDYKGITLAVTKAMGVDTAFGVTSGNNFYRTINLNEDRTITTAQYERLVENGVASYKKSVEDPLVYRIESKFPQKFGEDGKFRIAQFSDLHIGDGGTGGAKEVVETVVSNENPDFIVISGDGFNGGMQGLRHMINLMDEQKIPWTYIFGNHDYDGSNSAVKMYNTILAESEYFAGTNCGLDNNGNVYVEDTDLKAGNHVINIKNGEETPWKIFMIDNGAYAANPFTTKQKNWFKIEMAKDPQASALVFFHIPLTEYSYVQPDLIDQNVKTSLGVSGDYGGARNDGYPDTINPRADGTGMFQAFVDSGRVKGIFTGHDHLDDFIGIYKGIYLGFARTSDNANGYNNPSITGSSVYFASDRPFNYALAPGARIIDLDTSKPAEFTTYLSMIREPEEYRPGRAEKHYRPDKADNSGENLMDNICNYVKHSDNHYTVEQDLSLVK